MPALTPIPNIGSQLERAIIAWLFEAYGREKDIGAFYFSNDWKKRVPPLVDVFAHRSTEKVPHSRIEKYSVTLEWKWPGAVQPGEDNPDINWASINAFVGVGMAAMSQSDDDGETYRATANLIAQAGRRLAVLGTATGLDITAPPTQEIAANIANNADMVDFYCDYVEFKGSMRGVVSGGEVFLKEIRNFEIHACNLADDSVFAALTFDGAYTLGWVFSGDDSQYWIVEKSTDGLVWTIHVVVDGAQRTADISGSGTNWWRVRRSEDGVEGFAPESNIVRAGV